MVNSFFAVTFDRNSRSIYAVSTRQLESCGDRLFPVAQKIRLQGSSKILQGEELDGGTGLAIMDRLQMYLPEEVESGVFEKRIELLNENRWGTYSSLIVGLFLNKKDADLCFSSENLLPQDTRWKENTDEVLQQIGDDHPVFYVGDCYKSVPQ